MTPRADGLVPSPFPARPEVRPQAPRAGAWRRLLRLPLAPVRYALRRPLRAAGSLALALVLVTGIGAGGAWLWFAHHLTAARTELVRGHNAAALRHVARCRSLRPDDRDVLLLSARIARRSGERDEAEFFLDRCLDVNGQSEELVVERLLLRAARGEVETTGPALLARIRAGGPDADLCREALIAGLLDRFYWPQAFQQLNEWLAAEPDSTTALLLRGKLEEQRQARSQARDLYRRIVELDPEHDEARLRLTTLLLADRQGEEALGHLTVLRAHLPDHPEIAVQWARALALQGRNDESRSAIAECLAKHPDYPPALVERGARALLDGDETGAEQYLARAVALDPGNGGSRTQYALVLARNGKRAEAAKQEAELAALRADQERIAVLISGPLQDRPNDPAVHHEIALIALRSGQIREALRWFTSALRVAPDYAPTHKALAVLYHELNKPVLSAHHRALAHRPTDPLPKP